MGNKFPRIPLNGSPKHMIAEGETRPAAAWRGDRGSEGVFFGDDLHKMREFHALADFRFIRFADPRMGDDVDDLKVRSLDDMPE